MVLTCRGGGWVLAVLLCRARPAVHVQSSTSDRSQQCGPPPNYGC